MRGEAVLFRCHSFEGSCADVDIEHRLTNPRSPWTNGHVERVNRTVTQIKQRASVPHILLSSARSSRKRLAGLRQELVRAF